MTSKKRELVNKEPVQPIAPLPLLDDLRRMIEETRQSLAVTVNAALTQLYWRVGKRINDEILKGERADYGERILPTLSAKLTAEYGRGWSEKQLLNCLRTAETIELDTLENLDVPRRPSQTRFLRRNVPRRTVERPHPYEVRRSVRSYGIAKCDALKTYERFY